MVQQMEEEGNNEDRPANTLELFVELKDVLLMIDNLPQVTEGTIEKSYQVYSEVLGRYQEQPHLLDPHLNDLIARILLFIRKSDSSPFLVHAAYKFLYQIVKVRTYKVLVNFLPHELTDLEYVLIELEKQDLSDSTNWETRYVLLLWMSILVLNPFHMSRLDALTHADTGQTQSKMDRIFLICQQNTDGNDTCAGVAAFMTAKYLSRVDVCEKFLRKYFTTIMADHGEKTETIKVGQLAAIAQILKHGKRDNLLKEAPELLHWIVSCEFKNCSDYLKYKFYIKIIQRLGMVFLKPRLARWRYQRGSRSLVTNLNQQSGSVEDSSQLQSVEIRENFDDDIEVVDEIEEIIEELLQGLRSPSSDVRWSSAKGIGRITNRLSKSLGDEVVGTVVEMMSPIEPHEAWHGACLAIAELAKRGLLLPHRLSDLVPLLMQALCYDEMKSFMSVGQHIRDAACYMSWAFARAYNPQDLAPFVEKISSALLITTVFDREINCRRAASAAFQESVGRLGNFPHGIDILTVADFYSVGVRTNSFLEISDFIAQFSEYSNPLIDHLVSKKINHWDTVIRELAAKALNRLTKRSPEYMAKEIITKLLDFTDSIDVNTRHGGVLALGEITLALRELENDKNTRGLYLNPSIIDSLNKLILKFFDRDQFRGMSGEIMKQGCSDFIQNCSKARIEATDDCLDSWQSFIDKCLVNKSGQIREGATNALTSVCASYYNNPERKDRNLAVIDSYLVGCGNDLEEHIRMGYLSAVGAFPQFLLLLKIDEIIATLIKQSKIPNAVDNPNENPTTHNWSEARRDSIKALTALVQTIGFEDSNLLLENDKIDKIFACFLNGLIEYTLDNRGDIGAWVREASMRGLYQIVTLCPKERLNPDLVHQIMCGLAQQAVEKIDRTRGLAGRLFCLLVHHSPEIPHIKRQTELKTIFPENIESVLWLFADNTFPLFCSLLEFPEYSKSIILGLTASIGQLSESLVSLL